MIYKSTNNLEKLFPKTEHSVIIYFVQLRIHISFQPAWKIHKLFNFLIYLKK